MMLQAAERVIQKLNRQWNGWKSVSGLRRLMQGQITCLLYHRVIADGDRSWIEQGGVPVTRPEAFRQQLKLLKQIGCRFFTLQQIAAGHFPESHEVGVVITFDDGFADNFQVAQPILDSVGVPAVFFVASGLVDSTACNWDHQICWFLSLPEGKTVAAALVSEQLGQGCDQGKVAWVMRHLLTQDQIFVVLQSLRNRFGAVPESELDGLYATSANDLRHAIARRHEVGSHTVNHPMRHTLTQEQFTHELTESKRALELHLQSPVTSFSYPFNSFLFTDSRGMFLVARIDSRNRLPPLPKCW